MFAVSEVSQQRDMLVNLEMHMSESSEVIVSNLKPFFFKLILNDVHWGVFIND